jgi:hypothetical protein
MVNHRIPFVSDSLIKLAIRKYGEAWRADPDRYEELNRCLRECRIRLFGNWVVSATTSLMLTLNFITL